MFALINTGGKQYKVRANDRIAVEYLPKTQAGETIVLNRVLMVGEIGKKSSDDQENRASNDEEVVLGSPIIEGAKVTAELVKHYRDEKIIVFKKKRRHNYRRKKGHKRQLSLIQIKEISLA